MSGGQIADVPGGSRPGPAQAAPERRSWWDRVVERVKRIAARPGIAHLIATVARYNERFGSQFAGAMTYFTFLSLVPLLMVGFAVAGFVLAGNEQLLTDLEDQIRDFLPEQLAGPITGLINELVANPLAIGIPGLAVALYSGVGWMGNLRKAIRALWRVDFDKPLVEDNLAITLVKDLGALAGLGMAITVSIGISSFGTRGQDTVLAWLGLSDLPWLSTYVTVTTILFAIAADILIFLWIYTVVPGRQFRMPFQARLRGAIVTAAVFEILKFALTTLLPDLASLSRNAAIFGPVIGVLLLVNLTMQTVLLVAAWVATAPGAPRPAEPPDEVPEAAGAPVNRLSWTTLATLLGAGAAVGWWRARRKRWTDREPVRQDRAEQSG